MTTETIPAAARYAVIGCNDEQTVCDFCGKTNLKRTVILRDHEGDVVRVGSDCAIRACAVPGVRTKAQMDRRVAAARAEITALEFRRDQSTAVLADPARIALNADVSRNCPGGSHYGNWTVEQERASWQARLDAAVAELAARGIAA